MTGINSKWTRSTRDSIVVGGFITFIKYPWMMFGSYLYDTFKIQKEYYGGITIVTK